jgi:hypothetical protein
MAKETVVYLRDDLDGTEASETVRFGYQGVNYEIDLNEKNAAALAKALGKYVGAGRKQGRAVATSRPGRRTNGAASASRDLNDIRAWAKTNGFDVSSRGRIAAAVLEAYEAAH